MDAWLVIVIVVAVLVVIGLVAWSMIRKRRTQRLRDRFGPEYERTVEGEGRRRAEADLQEREQRREQIRLRDLSADERERFSGAWRDTQSEFVDSPGSAVRNADRLVQDVMRARGYPVEDFDQRAGDISVDHPELVQSYRAAHGISRRHERGDAGTEDLRQAVVHYRVLFAELLDDGSAGAGRGEGAPSERERIPER
jgi:hypothetical protein